MEYIKEAPKKLLQIIMNKKDHALLLLAILALIFSIFFFTRRNADAEVYRPTLVFIHSWEGRDETIELLVNDFEKTHPGIIINTVYKSYDEIREILFNKTETGYNNADEIIDPAAFEIIAIDPLWFAELSNEEIIEPLEFHILSFFYPLYYNIDILENAGFSGPPKTRTEFLTQARTVNNPETGLYAIAMALGEDNHRGRNIDIYSWIWASGLLTDPVPPRTLVARDMQAFTETLNFLSILKNENLILPAALDMNYNQKRQAFMEGRAAFMIGSAEDMELLRDSLGESVDYTAIPVPDNFSGRPAFASSGWSLAIARDSALLEEAEQLVSFIREKSQTLAYGWAVLEYQTQNIPVDPFYSKAWEIYISGDFISGFSAERKNHINNIFREGITDLFDGTAAASQTAAAILRNIAE